MNNFLPGVEQTFYCLSLWELSSVSLSVAGLLCSPGVGVDCENTALNVFIISAIWFFKSLSSAFVSLRSSLVASSFALTFSWAASFFLRRSVMSACAYSCSISSLCASTIRFDCSVARRWDSACRSNSNFWMLSNSVISNATSVVTSSVASWRHSWGKCVLPASLCPRT